MKPVLCCLFTLFTVTPVVAEEFEIQELAFPELGPTLLELATGEAQVPKLLYQMPEGWSEGETYPVFVFLAGGTGKGQREGGLGRRAF